VERAWRQAESHAWQPVRRALLRPGLNAMVSDHPKAPEKQQAEAGTAPSLGNNENR
jgi:hypothetical protein